MIVDLDREDLVALVKGTSPNYKVMDDPIIKRAGRYIGGFHDKWEWNLSASDDYNEEELWHMYITCRHSWK